MSRVKLKAKGFYQNKGLCKSKAKCWLWYISIQSVGWNSENHHFSWFLEFHPVFHFSWAATAVTKIFTAPTSTSTMIPLEPCALNAETQHLVLNFSISYWDLIKKSPYFTDTTERGVRGWKEAQREGEDKVTLRISLFPWKCICRCC
jgi:hypothetical protein